MIYNLFNAIRTRNISEEKIIELLAEATKSAKEIQEITRHGNNLLLASCLYDNDTAFKFFATKFHNEFKDYFKQCILFTYPNKNPLILKIAFEHLPTQSDEEKEKLLSSFANNCYRSENIEITQQWLQENLNKEQLEKFVFQLFKNNNKPFLNEIAKKQFWKEYIKNYSPTNNQEEKIFYNRLVAEPITVNHIDINETHEISVDTNKQERLIVKKKKKITQSTVPLN